MVCKQTIAGSQAGDITDVCARESWVYLAVIFDLFLRRVVAQRDLRANPFWVTDRRSTPVSSRICLCGPWTSQARSADHRQAAFTTRTTLLAVCRHTGAGQQMSGRGNCHDNSAVENILRDQAVIGVHLRPALTNAFAISITLRMIAMMAGLPAARRCAYLAFRSGLNRIATRTGISRASRKGLRPLRCSLCRAIALTDD